MFSNKKELTMKLLFFALSMLSSVIVAQDVQSVYDLPGSAVFPEGIAYDATSETFYVGSTADGTIFRGDVTSGEVSVLVPGVAGNAFSTIGMKVDSEGKLWVAGGGSGQIFAYDTTSGEQLASYATPPAEATFLNDLDITSTGDVYITDSNRPILFKVAAGSDTAESWLDFTDTAFKYGDGFNANGIALTDDDKYALIVQSDPGKLFRVDLATKEVSEVDLAGESLSNGDGLVLDGQTLYVVRNALQEIAVVDMAQDFSSGTVSNHITDANFAFPTTAALVGDSLLVVNSQFDKQGATPEPFTVSSVKLP
jgi:sugar lactone lactonase YvrE